MKKAHGFTIVELLVVIVVIAILAAITLVAYNSIQSRAQKIALTSDIRNLSQIIDIYEIENNQDVITLGNEESGGSYATFPGIQFSPSKSQYSDGNNLYICKNQSDPSYISIAAQTRSGDVVAYRSNSGFVEYTAAWNQSSTICPAALGKSGSFWFSYGRTTSGTWNSWTN